MSTRTLEPAQADHRRPGDLASAAGVALPVPEVLIAEARRLRRRRWALGLAIVLVVAGVVVLSRATGASRGAPGAPGSTTGQAPVAAGTVATVASLGRGAHIWTVDMLTRRSGFAIAGRASGARAGYLLATSDGGASWRVRGTVPFRVSAPTYAAPALVFANDRVGYVASGAGEGPLGDPHVYVTTDGGRAWSALDLSGRTPGDAMATLPSASTNESFELVDGVLAVVVLRCTPSALDGGGNLCPSALEEFPLGSTSPRLDRSIPTSGAVGPRQVPAVSARLLAALSPSTLIVATGDLEGVAPVLQSSNAGRTWTPWHNPCASLRGATGIPLEFPAQELQAFPHDRLVLTCYQAGGMSQGTTVVTASHDGGRTWHVVSEGSEGAAAGGLRTIGNVGDMDAQLWSSTDGTVVWEWIPTLGATIFASADGGRTYRPTSGVGGPIVPYPTTMVLDPVGPHGAILVTSSGATFATSDGHRWRHVALLPSGRPSARRGRLSAG